MTKPDFFMVGAPKCGTTAMYNYLSQHPEIFMPAQKEVHYFGSDLFLPGTEIDEQAYLAHFSGATNEKRIGHSFNCYLFSTRAAQEIERYNPSTNIVIMLRNPVDMIYSLHSQRLYSGLEDLEDFAEAIEAEEERRRGLRPPIYSWMTRGLFYLEVAKYAAQVERYVDVFGWAKIKIILLDDLKSNPRQIYRETCQFLGVEPEFEPVMRILNSHKKARSKTARDLLDRQPPAPIQKLGRLLVPQPLRRSIYRTLKNLNSDYKPRPPMNTQLRRRLQTEYQPDVERLSDLLGRDLTYWCTQ